VSTITVPLGELNYLEASTQCHIEIVFCFINEKMKRLFEEMTVEDKVLLPTLMMHSAILTDFMLI